ncbi:DsbA family protein [Patescibacteria group bacterium]|nr:DsbA family protein [Patescibacteria group bacterium]
MASEKSNSPYSMNAMLDFVTNNAGLLFLGVSLLVVGFLGGAMWRENAMLKAGIGGGTGTQIAAGAGDPGAAAPAPATELSEADWKAVQEGGVGVIGQNNAKVTMVEFTDYQCPFCSRHYTTAYKTIKEKYIDTGKVKLVLRDQALPFHPNAKPAAIAVRCAVEQNKGKLEAMHDTLFDKQDEWSNLSADQAAAKFGEYATANGLNGATLTQCVKDGKFSKEVEADMALGTKVGASGTPTFFINGKMVVGAQDISVFETEIENALNS